MSTSQPFRGLPALAGLATFDAAQQPGLSVEQCVRRLKRFHYAFKRLHEICLARLTAERVYELKMAFSLHAHYCAEHVAALRQRVGEMREPPLGLDIVPDPALEIFFDEILAAPTTEELLLGIYAHALPVLGAALEKHRSVTNPLADAPTVRLIKFALLELEEMDDYGSQAITAFDAEIGTRKAEIAAWLEVLDEALAAAGGGDGTGTKSGETVARK